VMKTSLDCSKERYRIDMEYFGRRGGI